MKRCTKCGVEKPTGDYHRDKYRRDGLRCRCKSCSIEDNGPRSVRRDRSLRLRYGITLADHGRRIAAQNRLCAICDDGLLERRSHQDHDHRTTEARGVLCIRCNALVAAFESPHASRVVEYLEAWAA